MNKKNVLPNNIISKVLTERSNVSLINPYKKLFAINKDERGHIYRQETSIETYMMFAYIDDHCSATIQRYISIFERKLKMTLGYELSKTMCDKGDLECVSYSDKIKLFLENNDEDGLFDCGFNSLTVNYTKNGYLEANVDLQARRRDFLKKLMMLGNGETRSQNTLIQHYQAKQVHVPFWLLVHDLSLGDLQLLFNILDPQLRQEIYQHFIDKKSDPRELFRFSGLLETIRRLRNVISHNETLFGYFQGLNRVQLNQHLDAIEKLKMFHEKAHIPKVKDLSIEKVLKNDFNKNLYAY